MTSRKRSIFLFVAVFLLISSLVGYGHRVAAEGADLPDIQPAKGPSMDGMTETRIVMARSAPIDELERPPVVFNHKRHSEAAKEMGCQACHSADEKGKIVYELVAWKEGDDRDDFIHSAHEKCMVCHGGKRNAPVEAERLGCGECHVDSLEYKNVEWYPATFDHINHIDAMDEGCDTCHHQPDKKSGKLTYKKGQEHPCGKCHKDKNEETGPSLRKVGHMGCIGCHEKQYAEREARVNPYDCRVCHRPEMQPSEPDVKRLVVRTYQAEPRDLLISHPGAILPPVPFAHEKHVGYDQKAGRSDCNKACHQFHVRTIVSIDSQFLDTSDACRQCHAKTNAAVALGSIASSKIYHNAESSDSCIGCHEKAHQMNSGSDAPVNCVGCHTGQEKVLQPLMAASAGHTKFPEVYAIDDLSNKYFPVKFQHKMHSEMIGACDACHHHGPKRENPKCGTCHGAPQDFQRLAKPRLVSAYHRMCIGCHRSMGIGPVTCNECHEEREQEFSPAAHLELPELTKMMHP